MTRPSAMLLISAALTLSATGAAQGREDTQEASGVLSDLAKAEQLLLVRTLKDPTASGRNGEVEMRLAQLECSDDGCSHFTLNIRPGGTKVRNDLPAEPLKSFPEEPTAYQGRVENSEVVIEWKNQMPCLEPSTGDLTGPMQASITWSYRLALQSDETPFLRGSARQERMTEGSPSCQSEHSTSDFDVLIVDPARGSASSPAPMEWWGTLQYESTILLATLDVRDCEPNDPEPCQFVIREQRPADQPDGTQGHYVIDHVLNGNPREGFSGGVAYSAGCFIDGHYLADSLEVQTKFRVQAANAGGGQFLHVERTRVSTARDGGACPSSHDVDDWWLAPYEGEQRTIDVEAAPGRIIPDLTTVPSTSPSATSSTASSASPTDPNRRIGVADGVVVDSNLFATMTVRVAKAAILRGVPWKMSQIVSALGVDYQNADPTATATPRRPLTVEPIDLGSMTVAGVVASDEHSCTMAAVRYGKGAAADPPELLYTQTNDLTRCTTKGFVAAISEGMYPLPDS